MSPASDLVQDFRFNYFKHFRMSPIVVYFDKKNNKIPKKELVGINWFWNKTMIYKKIWHGYD